MTQEQSVSDDRLDRRAIPASAREDWWNAPDGQAIRRIDWPSSTSEPRGSLLFLPGRADFYEKYLEALDHWHRRGWTVTALDWRGQGYSGRLGDDGATGHVEDYLIWADDLAAFWRQWTQETPPPHVLVGHSMGGHIVLRALAARKVEPDAVILSAPMLGLQPQFLPRRLLHILAKMLVKRHGGRQSAWKGSERPGQTPRDRLALLTHDAERYADEAWWRQKRPLLELGAPSWGWIDQSLASMAEIVRPGALEAVTTPILILASRKDRLVSYRTTKAVSERLPQAELVTFGTEARHEILREADPVRTRALAIIDRFLDENAPAAGTQT